MKAELKTEKVVPPTRVVLDLSVEEFCLLYLLHRSGNGGFNSIRSAVERGLEDVVSELPDSLAKKVRRAKELNADRRSGRYPSDVVTEVFA